MKNPRKITVTEAAKVMGKAPLFVSEMMKQGRLPIGEAEKIKGNVRYDFYISPKLLADYVGLSVEQLWKEIEYVRN